VAGIAAHQLHQADAVGNAGGLDVRRMHRVRGDGDGGLEAEGAADIGDVVVDGLRDADDGDGQATAFDLFPNGRGAAHRAVAADGEEHVYLVVHQTFDDFRRR